jgi:hypothetical protein
VRPRSQQRRSWSSPLRHRHHLYLAATLLGLPLPSTTLTTTTTSTSASKGYHLHVLLSDFYSSHSIRAITTLQLWGDVSSLDFSFDLFFSLTICGALAVTAGDVRVYLIGYIFCIIDCHIYRNIFGRIYIMYCKLPYVSRGALPSRLCTLYIPGERHNAIQPTIIRNLFFLHHEVPWNKIIQMSKRVLHDRMYHGVHLLVIDCQQHAGNCAPKNRQPLMSQLRLMVHRWLVCRLR